jgi:hypothetical protein
MQTGNQTTPANQVAGVVTLDYVVAEMQNELDDYGPRQRSRLLGLAISALREFRLYDQALQQIAYIQINDAGIAVLPKDYVDYITIGTLTHAGNVRPYTLNNSMALERGVDCGEPSRVMDPDMAVQNQNVLAYGPFTINPYWSNNNIIPTYYGVGGGYNNAYYKIDKAAGVIQFNGVIPKGEIVLVYKSTGISPTTVVPYEMIEPIKAWAHDRRELHDARVPMNKKQLNKQNLDEARSKLRAFTQKFTISEYLDHCVYRNKKQSPKP